MTRTRSQQLVGSDAASTTTVSLAPGMDFADSPRRRNLRGLLWSALFTVVQVWALLTVLVQLQPEGVSRAALACVMAAAVTAVMSAWQESTY